MPIYKGAILGDFKEELWPSMDSYAENLTAAIRMVHPNQSDADLIRPPLRHVFQPSSSNCCKTTLFNMERAYNRYVLYPSLIRRMNNTYDFYHIVDHSYAHLSHYLPPNKTVITLHDFEMFKCLFSGSDSRSAWYFKPIAEWVLQGLRKATVIFFDSQSLRADLERLKIPKSTQLIYVPVAIDEIFFSNDGGSSIHDDLRGMAGKKYVLNVGSNAPRKRLDFLLKIFKELSLRHEALKLIQVGARWNKQQENYIEQQGLAQKIIQFPHPQLSNRELAYLYKNALLTILTSEYEGFGMPVIEALACGCAVIASDIPTFRETGGVVTEYCGLYDMKNWLIKIGECLTRNSDNNIINLRRQWAEQFRWVNTINVIYQAYEKHFFRKPGLLI